ncbi:MAG: ribonuclease HII [Anaerolineae bacterium]|jgi:ribonuclease HII|nr:ribonuclease HII [Anaerolineae bacterium]
MEKKVLPTFQYERQFWDRGLIEVAGVDEAGRGCWAGPVTAGAIIFPADERCASLLAGVRDSKQMSPKQREMLLPVIQQNACTWAVGWATNVEIDAYGIVPATRLAMLRAIESLLVKPQALLIDAVQLFSVAVPQHSMKFGDALSLSIAAASIVAKVFRDRWMMKADNRFPGFGFAQHKGYGTRQHQQALTDRGASVLHRMTFRPIRDS